MGTIMNVINKFLKNPLFPFLCFSALFCLVLLLSGELQAAMVVCNHIEELQGPIAKFTYYSFLIALFVLVLKATKRKKRLVKEKKKESKKHLFYRRIIYILFTLIVFSEIFFHFFIINPFNIKSQKEAIPTCIDFYTENDCISILSNRLCKRK